MMSNLKLRQLSVEYIPLEVYEFTQVSIDATNETFQR